MGFAIPEKSHSRATSDYYCGSLITKLVIYTLRESIIILQENFRIFFENSLVKVGKFHDKYYILLPDLSQNIFCPKLSEYIESLIICGFINLGGSSQIVCYFVLLLYGA